MQDYPRVPEMELVRRSDPYLTVSLRILVTRGDKTHMATTTRRFASALTALAVMGSGAQFFDPVANAVSSTEQDSNINCADARKAVFTRALFTGAKLGANFTKTVEDLTDAIGINAA